MFNDTWIWSCPQCGHSTANICHHVKVRALQGGGFEVSMSGVDLDLYVDAHCESCGYGACVEDFYKPSRPSTRNIVLVPTGRST